MGNKKQRIENFWWFHNTNCWRIKRESLVDFYLFLPTMRYIYKTPMGEWRGTKNHLPMILLSEKERKKLKKFSNENDAVLWLSGKGEK